MRQCRFCLARIAPSRTVTLRRMSVRGCLGLRNWLSPDRAEYSQRMPHRLHLRSMFEQTGPEVCSDKTLYLS